MKTKNFPHLLSVLTVVTATVACAESNEGTVVPPDRITTDTGVIEVSVTDTAVGETTTDTGSVQDTMTGDALDRCVYPATETEPCGGCGTHSRFCLPDGVWTGFTGCAGEKVEPECTVGSTRMTECGNCGKSKDFCDVKTCTWTTGVCAGSGPCVEGDEQLSAASCPVAGETRKRICDSKCQWSEFSECGLARGWIPMAAAPSSMLGRQRHSAVWTGTSMIVWGGYNGIPTTTALEHLGDGAAYDLASDTWRLLPASLLSGRREHAAVWTGSSMIVWGGYGGSFMDDGAAFNPSTNKWTPIAASPLSERSLVASAWSSATGEMLIWGGCGSTTCATAYADGAAYNPTTNTWTKLPSVPLTARGDAAFGMIDGEFVILAGRDGTTSGFMDGARFNPVTRHWTTFPAPSTTMWSARAGNGWANTGTSLVLYGGRTSTTTSTHLDGSLVYTPGVGYTTFGSPTDTDFGPSAKRYAANLWFGSGKLFVFSGEHVSSDLAGGGFVSYDTSTATWGAESTPTAMPAARTFGSVVWTGREAIIWGGGADDLENSTTAVLFKDGAVFRP